MQDPSGTAHRFYGCSAGKGANAAKTELEKILNRAGTEGITCRQAVLELGRMYVHFICCSSRLR
jgi:20S proteasome alpha/beta subunit